MFLPTLTPLNPEPCNATYSKMSMWELPWLYKISINVKTHKVRGNTRALRWPVLSALHRWVRSNGGSTNTNMHTHTHVGMYVWARTHSKRSTAGRGDMNYTSSLSLCIRYKKRRDERREKKKWQQKVGDNVFRIHSMLPCDEDGVKGEGVSATSTVRP